MSEVGKRLKVLVGEHIGKIGKVIAVDEQRGRQIIQFENGQEAEFSLWQIGVLEWLDFKPLR